jgi:hypothetical protein
LNRSRLAVPLNSRQWHLNYLATGHLRGTRTERDAAGGVQWCVERARPILPEGMKPLAGAPTDGQ